MAKAKHTTGSEGNEYVNFWCPGCNEPHYIRVKGPSPWGWNGSLDAPTFSPSVRVSDGTGTLCHSFVTNGRIQFLPDSAHKLAGQTVDLPDWPEDWNVA